MPSGGSRIKAKILAIGGSVVKEKRAEKIKEESRKKEVEPIAPYLNLTQEKSWNIPACLDKVHKPKKKG